MLPFMSLLHVTTDYIVMRPGKLVGRVAQSV